LPILVTGLLIGIGIGAAFLASLLPGVLRGRQRVKERAGDPIRVRKRMRLYWIGLLWFLVLPIALVSLWVAGFALGAVSVLIAYVFLTLMIAVLVRTILVPRARRRAGR
jgi:membrane protein YdbS with pleckstrin-like domain